MKAREYKKFEEANLTTNWFVRMFCKHEFVGHRLDDSFFDTEHLYLYITCGKCGEQYICNNFFTDKKLKHGR